MVTKSILSHLETATPYIPPNLRLFTLDLHIESGATKSVALP